MQPSPAVGTPTGSEVAFVVGKVRSAFSIRGRSSKAIVQFPPGHYYSPIPSLEEVRRDESRIFLESPLLPGIDLREQEQMLLLQELIGYYSEMPFTATKSADYRYFFENPYYSYSDGIFLYSMLRHYRPKRLIEVGSGFSSCVVLDTNEFFLSGELEVTFIDPYPKQLVSLVSEEDLQGTRLIASRLQDVPIEEFAQLKENDFLFVDSTHVSKVFSDVNRLFFEILPSLNSGVYIHFHDVFYPFEYPKEWIYRGCAWNEIYLLHAFLQHNDLFRIVLMNTFLEARHREFFARGMPLCLKNTGGSIWLKKWG